MPKQLVFLKAVLLTLGLVVIPLGIGPARTESKPAISSSYDFGAKVDTTTASDATINVAVVEMAWQSKARRRDVLRAAHRASMRSVRGCEARSELVASW